MQGKPSRTCLLLLATTLDSGTSTRVHPHFLLFSIHKQQTNKQYIYADLSFWCPSTGLPATLDLLYTPDRVNEWILWLEAYYGPGSTVRNKTWNVKNFVRFLRTNIRGLNGEQMQDLITCKRTLGDTGNRNKIQAALNRIMLADENHMTAEGTQPNCCWLLFQGC